MLSIIHGSATVRFCLGHAVVDATEVWLDPTDNRAHNRVVSTLPLEVACERIFHERDRRPSMSTKRVNVTGGKGLVSPSASMAVVLTYSIERTERSTSSRR